MHTIRSWCRANAMLVISLLAAAATAFFVPLDSAYLGYYDLKTLSCLFSVLAVVGALRDLDVFSALSQRMVHTFSTVRGVCTALVIITMFGSMLLTNDTALLTFLPLGWFVLSVTGQEKHAALLFNVVFLSTIISLLVQGTTVSGMANLLGLAYEERESAFNVEMHEEMKSALTEVEVNENLLASGHTLKDITLPENTLVMMVCRDGEYFVPQGKTELKLGDKLLVISDRSEELASTYKDMGIDDVMKLG